MRRRYRRSPVIILALCLLIVLALRLLGPDGRRSASGPSGPSSSASAATTTDAAGQTWRVLRVVDGDTIRVLYQGVDESARLLRINTPERGRPGYRESTEAMR